MVLLQQHLMSPSINISWEHCVFALHLRTININIRTAWTCDNTDAAAAVTLAHIMLASNIAPVAIFIPMRHLRSAPFHNIICGIIEPPMATAWELRR